MNYSARSLALFSPSPVSHGFFQDDFRCLIGGLPARSPLLRCHCSFSYTRRTGLLWKGRTNERPSGRRPSVRVALNVLLRLRIRNHFSKRARHSAAEMWRRKEEEGGLLKPRERSTHAHAHAHTNINRKELHNPGEDEAALHYVRGWRVVGWVQTVGLPPHLLSVQCQTAYFC